jgi:hypothetical protein
MRVFLFCFLACVLFFSKSFGQLSPSDKHIMDSLLENDEMLKMINSYYNPSSYFRVNISIGNKLYSDQNKAIESLQNNNQLIISPSIGYYHKSGLGLSFTGFLFNENSKTEFYQYALSPFFNYTKGNVFNTAFSYTHYFVKDIYNPNTSPVQNEFYGSIVLKKPWIRPGVSAGYSYGTYHDIIKIDTFFRIGNQQHSIKYIDTVSARLNSFSLAGTLEHSFSYYNIFSKKDGINFTPQLSLIAGINTYQVNHKSSIENYNRFTKKLIKRLKNFQTQSESDRFEAQSIGLDLDVSYLIGIFYIEPELYLDYYLPETNDKRLTKIFNLNIGITF